MDKGKAKQEVEKIVKKFLAIPKKELDGMKEEQIKFRFIEPLLEVLGWEREDINKEERVLKGRADYILRIGNQDKLVIEAKKTSVKLSENEGKQAVSYAHHKNIKFSVLTNFKQIRVYHALSNIKHIDKNLLKDEQGLLWIDCENFIKEFDRLWLLSKESFEQGEINKLLDNVDKKLIKPIDESILADLLQYREWLSKDLKSKRNYLENSQIDEIVQILIDRLIFMRSVEDRGLEAQDFLLKIINDVEKGFTDMNLWAVLKTQFQRFDKTYNSKLFQEGLLEKEGFFDNKVLVKVIRGLYYGTQDHQERYMFDEIPVDLLGSIYEQYLGIVLRGTEKRVKLDLLSRKRKKMGIYYTPSYIVDYIIKNTVGEYCKNKSIDEILDIKIIDPACGSGSFLIKAFQEVINIIEERLKNGEKSDKYQNTFKEWKGKLSLGEKTTILTNCIYGVDLDEKAVELAQLNLLLKILEEETRETRKRVLPTMRDNIKNGNSLISNSRFDKAFNWNAQFPKIKEGGFDIVVGNPPYIDSEEMVKTQPKTRDYCNKNYETAKGNWDIFGIFIEKGLKLLKQDGMFGMIVPNKLLSAKYTEALRDFIENKKQIINIRDYSKIPVFSASVYPVVVIIKNNFDSKNTLITEVMEQEGEEIKIKESNKIKQKNLIDSSEKTWAYIFEKEGRDMLNKILENSTPLDELSKVFGSATVSEAYEVKKYLKELSNEKDYFKFINTGTIDRYAILWDSSKTRYIKCSYEKPMILKKDLEKISKKRVSESEQQKIIVAGMTKVLECCIDESGEYLAGKSTSLVIPEKIDSLVILSILNSRLMTFVYKKLYKSLSLAGGYIRVGPPQIKNLPIKIPDEKQSKKIKELVDRIIKFHKEGKSEQDIKNVDYEIDQEVYKLYGITDKEKEIIEKSLNK